MAKAKITKTEAVRQAIAANADKPTEGVAWIKEKYGIDMKTNHFSIFKSSLRKKKVGRKKKSPAVAEQASVAPATNGQAHAPSTTWTSAVRQLTDLVEEHGAKRVREVVELLTM